MTTGKTPCRIKTCQVLGVPVLIPPLSNTSKVPFSKKNILPPQQCIGKRETISLELFHLFEEKKSSIRLRFLQFQIPISSSLYYLPFLLGCISLCDLHYSLFVVLYIISRFSKEFQNNPITPSPLVSRLRFESLKKIF